jgi:hypothetical protein
MLLYLATAALKAGALVSIEAWAEPRLAGLGRVTPLWCRQALKRAEAARRRVLLCAGERAPLGGLVVVVETLGELGVAGLPKGVVGGELVAADVLPDGLVVAAVCGRRDAWDDALPEAPPHATSVTEGSRRITSAALRPGCTS